MLVPPATQNAQNINDLFTLIYILSAIVFVLVEGLLIIAAIRFRRRRADEMPEQVHGHAALEVTWTVIPAVVIAGIFAISVEALGNTTGYGTLSAPVSQMHAIGDVSAALRADRAEKVDMVIKVVGRQWLWQYTYPDPSVTINSSGEGELILPAGRMVRLDLTSADVLHAWWMPAFGPMIYVSPGDVSYIWIKAAPGLYHGQCNVFCGVAHAKMLSNVRVLPAAEWDEWYKQQVAKNAGPAQPGNAERGKAVFLGGACMACHTVAGTTAQGKVAPRELTHFASLATIGDVAGFTNNKENLEKWLANPPAIKPGTVMPNLNLKPQEIADLVAWLETLK